LCCSFVSGDYKGNKERHYVEDSIKSEKSIYRIKLGRRNWDNVKLKSKKTKKQKKTCDKGKIIILVIGNVPHCHICS
jgi:hypothetical protein